ncbi:hypothetical protein MOTC310_00700 [Methylobacterium oryzae]|uniref:Uncharacterized protein n=1 Tax=Methylobacterium oryzae TaxID=334852 RepID=A0ABU7THR5_9HYPH
MLVHRRLVAEGAGCGAGPLSRTGEGQGEGCDLSGQFSTLTPTLSRTGEGARRVTRATLTHPS